MQYSRLALSWSFHILSTMRPNVFDATIHERLAELGQRVLNGGRIDRDEALWLFGLEDTADVFELMAWANRIRERYKGNKIHLCSIVNAKAGACSENCSFCAQSAFHQTGSPRYGFVDPEPVQNALDEAQKNGVTAVGLVAAWRGLNEGPMLDEVCDRISEMRASGKSRPDASLGLIKSQKVADRLKAAGLECYGHNLESSRRFFPQHCTTHAFEDRLETIGYLKKAGIKICSGGIIGMGETRNQRAGLLAQLANMEQPPESVPINLLTQVEGTPLHGTDELNPFEFVRTIAAARITMPKSYVRLSAGRQSMSEGIQALCFLAGANSIFYGEKLLTTGNPEADADKQLFAKLGLHPI